MSVSKVSFPSTGSKIKIESGKLSVPDNPQIPYITGDGIGTDITPVMIKVVDAAVEKAFAGQKKISWFEIFCGEKALGIYGDDVWLPEETLELINEYKVAIKGPLATPVSGGLRSLNVALRQKLDLYLCQRPVRWYQGVPSPVKRPADVDMVIFRENSEDIYAGIDFEADSAEANTVIEFLIKQLKVEKIRFPQNCGIGVKPVSEEGSKRLIRKAFQYAIDHDKDNVTLVHKGNIMKYTEGAFRNWGFELAEQEFGGKLYQEGPWRCFKNPNNGKEIIVKDAIADAFLQQILTRPKEFSVIATCNLNGDYISDALAAQVGGIGIAPGANISDEVALFEATHGTAPKYIGMDKVNPGSLLLSAVMMLEHIGFTKAGQMIVEAMEQVISSKKVTYDFARLLDGATKVKCSEFGDLLIANINSN